MEKSESGAPIIRHENRERDFELAHGDSVNLDKISDHIEKYVGPVSNVFHELISDLIHVDVHIVKPSVDRNYYTLITFGMSDLPMTAPDEYSECRYSELLICLPPTWPMTEDSWNKEENYWPIRTLKFLSRFPHEYQTWLWSTHTIPNGNPAEPFSASVEMSSVILLPPVLMDDDFKELKVSNEKTIHFHAIIPLYNDEMEMKLKKGVDALFDGFDECGMSELFNPERRSVVVSDKKKRSWFSFKRDR